jgi:anti-anti-sigma factor
MAEVNGDGASMTFELLPADGSARIVKLDGELDITTIDDLDEAVKPIIDADPERLVVDVSGLRFADSSAIALWVKWSSTVRALEIRDPSPLLRRVIESMGLAQTLGVTP